MDQRGQLSVDLLFATLIILIIIASITSLVSSGILTANNAGLSQAKVIADDVANAINTNLNDGDGHYTQLSLPNINQAYTVTINGNMVVVSYNGLNATSKIMTNNVVTAGTSNSPVLQNGSTYNISNVGGVINIQ